MIRDHFSFLRLPLGKEMSRNRASNQMVLSEVSQSELEIEDPVSDGDQGVSTEHDGGASTRGFCKLGEEDARHAGLEHDAVIEDDHDESDGVSTHRNNDPNYALNTHDNYCK